MWHHYRIKGQVASSCRAATNSLDFGWVATPSRAGVVRSVRSPPSAAMIARAAVDDLPGDETRILGKERDGGRLFLRQPAPARADCESSTIRGDSSPARGPLPPARGRIIAAASAVGDFGPARRHHVHADAVAAIPWPAPWSAPRYRLCSRHRGNDRGREQIAAHIHDRAGRCSIMTGSAATNTRA